MTFMLKDPGQSVSLHPALQSPPAGFADTFRAGRTAEDIETDTWNLTQRRSHQLLEEMVEAVGDHAELPPFSSSDTRGQGPAGQRRFADQLDYVTAAIAELRTQTPTGRFGDLPATVEEFEAEVTRRLRSEWDDAQEVLETGGAVPEFFGRMRSGLTDQSTLLTLPFGAPAGARVLTAVGVEAALGATGEALTLPRQYRVAERLDIPEPDPFLQVGMSALLSGGLGGVLSGAQRAYHYHQIRGQVSTDQRPEGQSAVAFERSLAEARAATEANMYRFSSNEPDRGTLGDLVGEQGRGGLSMRDFDFSRDGNASPRSNRIGYVFGKLLSLGYEPHVAAGLVGNIMQESGVGVNTRAVGDNGNSFGMSQWNGPRRRAYLQYAQSKGKDPGDLDTQIEFLHFELTGSESRAAAAIMAASSAREAAAIASQQFWRPGIPHIANRQAFAGTVMEQYQRGEVPRWQGAVSPSQRGAPDFAGYTTSRGYTSSGQVVVGDDMRLDVVYEVVDLRTLRRASGDLQPRDRSRIASDAWVADTAARLDPALLMPSPTADRGAPLVGPDGVIESGNGRTMAIREAYQRFPDRAEAYRVQIESAGFPIPEGVDRPVLIARRQSELAPPDRRRLVVDAQDSGVARMTATERAQIGARALDADRLALMRPDNRIATTQNRDFARAFASAMPRSERNAAIGDAGEISADGIRMIRDALFARAWDDPALIARAIEGEPGPLKKLLSALQEAAPAIARLRAAIDAGDVLPEMDITPYVIEAVQLISAARDAAVEGTSVAALIDEVLDRVDLFGNSIAPLTQAFVRAMTPGRGQMSAEKIADLLTRYADDARKAGRVGQGVEPPTPLEILRRISPKLFGDLTEMGPRPGVSAAMTPPAEPLVLPETAFANGALSAETEAADLIAEAGLREAELFPDLLPIRAADGEEIAPASFLDDLEADEDLLAVLDACPLGRAG